MTTSPRLSAAILLVLTGACSVDLSVPLGLTVTCTSDADCPADSACNPLTSVCDFNSGNNAPVTAFTAVGTQGLRASTTVKVDFDSFDSNAPPVGEDTVQITLTYSVDGTTWCDATVIGDMPTTRAERTTGSIGWDALADATRVPAGDPCALATTQLITTPDDETTTTTVLAFADNLRLRLASRDSAVPPASTQTTSEVFSIGNDSPTFVLLDDNVVLRQASPFEFTLADSSADPSRIQVQFQISGETQWHEASLRGSTSGVIADTPGSEANRLLVWDADSALPASPAQTGGIGHTNASVTLRGRAIETVLDGVTTYSTWSSFSGVVHNQTPPVVGAVDVIAAEPDYATSLVFVGYEVIDAEADDIDVRLEYSIGGAEPWFVATPYPSILHSGSHDLSTAAVSPNRHTFVWSVGSDVDTRLDNVFVRLTAADDGGAGEPAIVSVPFSLGAIPDIGWLYPVAQTVGLGTAGGGFGGPLLGVGDFNGDGVDDYIAWTESSPRYLPGVAGGGFGAAVTLGEASYRTRALAIADVNNDGYDDIFVNDQNGDPVRWGRGGPTGPVFTGTGVTAYATASSQVVAGDFNGNGNVDLALNTNTGVVVYRGNGAGGFDAGVTIPLGGDVYGFAAGDFNNDGVADLAYAIATAVGSGEIIKITPLEVRVRFGDTSGTLTSTYETVAQAVGLWEDGQQNTRVGLGAGDPLGRGFDQVVLVDYEQPNLSRLRLFERTSSFVERALVTGLPPLHHAMVQDRIVVVGGTDYTSGWLWNADQERLDRVTPLLPSGSGNLRFHDLNGDGTRDLVVVNGSSIEYRPRVDAKGQPALATETQSTVSIGDGNVLVRAADIDEDGLADVFVGDGLRTTAHAIASFRAGSVRDLSANALTVANPLTFLLPPSTYLADASTDTFMGDFNGDGTLDAVLGAYSTAYFVNLGSSTSLFAFETPKLIASIAQGGRTAVGDFNGDGRDDILAAESTAYVSSAAGAVGTVTSFQTTTLATANEVAAGDLDADGVDDVVIAYGQTISLYFGNRSAGLSAACTTTLPAGQAVSSLTTGDVDGNGDADVVAVATSVTYAFAVSRCAFTTINTSAFGDLRKLRLVDVDGDGVLDITGARGFGSGTLHVAGGLETAGRANGKFGPLLLVAPANNPVFDWGDINRDDVPELFLRDASVLRVVTGRRYNPQRQWTASLDASAVIGTIPPTDRLGNPWRLDIVARRTIDRNPGLVHGSDIVSGFTSRAVVNGLTLPAGATGITAAWRFEGDFATDSHIDDGVRSVRARETLGGASVIVDMPIYNGATTDAAKITVLARHVTGYETSSDGALVSTPTGQTAFRPVFTWSAVPLDSDGDPTTGSGARFIVDASNRRIRVVTPTLGVFQAYASP